MPAPEGRVVIRITIDREGRIVHLAVAQSSGIAAFDEAALRMVRRAEPLPRPPPDIASPTPRLLLPVEFRDR
ncbi:energy transducer TonB family protein [Enterovirga rhinocerotis]|uniref:energy transducer TonB family protein n=1 Tax=Enterovirga rhinocerotis TaxID=1339210 RepID=UPI0014151343